MKQHYMSVLDRYDYETIKQGRSQQWEEKERERVGVGQLPLQMCSIYRLKFGNF